MRYRRRTPHRANAAAEPLRGQSVARTRRRRLVRLAALPLVAAIGVLGACGDDDEAADGDAGTGVSADARAGEQLFNAKGCAGCHSTGAAPDLDGIYMEEVELEDGRTLTRDDEYLERAIRDPGADIVAGATLSMPTVSLSDDEVAQLVAYIRELTP